MTQKRKEADSGKAIEETTALRWEPTHVTKPNPRVVPLHRPSTSNRDTIVLSYSHKLIDRIYIY